MDANVTIQIQNKHKGEFSTRILDASKDRFASRKKCNYVFTQSQPTSPVI